jgi:LPS export ABC transporter protein LptC
MKLNLRNIISVFLVCLLASACSEEKVNPGIDKNGTDNEISSEGWNSQLMQTDNGKLRYTLHYEHMMQYAEKRITLLSKIKVDFYDSTQTSKSWLTADSGRVEEDGAVMYGIGNVIAKNDSGRVLKTEQLVWRNKTQKISTDRFVTITSPKEDLQGYGFESDQFIKNWTIFKPILNTVINDDKNKK